MITFKMRRRGEFIVNFTTTKNQCGSGGQKLYRYVCEIEVGEALDDHGFILDNYKVQEYFDREYGNATTAYSCERIAQIATMTFLNMLRNRQREVHRISVTIFGSEQAGLTATWRKEVKAAQEELGLGTADMWHNGTKSYYRAKLLKKLTMEEALFDPTEEPIEVVKIDLSKVEKRVIQMTEVPLACDFCKESVESDHDQKQKEGAQWIHKHGYYTCLNKNFRGANVATVSGSTVATVNGSENVPQEVT